MGLMKVMIKVSLPVALTAVAYSAARMRELQLPRKEKPHSDAPIIVAMGDSITFGSGVKASRATDSWESKLEKLFCGSYQVLNYGISGATLQDEGDAPYWHMPQRAHRGFPEAALALNPKIILLMLGTNDSKPYNWNRERYEAQLDTRVKELMQSGAQVILMCPPYACAMPGHDVVEYDILNDTIRDEIVPIIKSCAEQNGTACIDLYALTDGHSEYFVDGVHPNSFGNRVIAAEIHRFLTQSESADIS